MITTSTVIKQMLNSPLRTIKGKVEFYKGSTLAFTANGEDILKDFAIQRAGEESKFFGFGICQKLTANILDPQRAKSILKGDSCQVYLGAEGEYSAPYPRFFTDDVARDENTNELKVIAYDALYGAGALTVADLSAAAPYTIESFATACARLIGLEGISIVGVSDNSFAASYASGANFDGSESIRSALNAIAEITQTIYFINNSNKLVFKRINNNENSVLDITKDKYFTLKSQSARVLGKIVHATELGDNLETGAAGDVQYIRDNPFWTLLPSTDVAARLEAAIAAVGGLTITPFECDWRGNFLLEPGDKVTLTAKDDSVFSTYILEDTVEYNGALHGKTKWNYKASKSETAANPTTIGEKLNQTFARVDKIEKEIKLYVGEVVEESVDELINGAISESMGELQQDIKDLQANDTATDQLLQQLETDMGELEKQGAATDQKVAQLTLTTDGINASVESLSTEQATIKNNLNTVTGEQTSIKSDIAALKVKDNEIAADISSLEQSHTTLNTKVTGIEGEVSTVKTEQSTLKQQQATLTTNLEGITGRVSDVEEKSTEIEDEVAGIKAAHSETSNKVATLETNLNGITGRVSSVESTNTSQANEISGIKSAQNTQSTKLAEMETTLEGFGTRVSNVETKNSQISNEITGIKNSQTTTTNQLTELIGDFESITARVKSVEEKNTSQDNEITGVKSTQSSHSTRLGELTTSLDGITGRVSDVEATTSTLEGEVAGVKSTQSTQSSKIGELELTTSGFDTRISNTETTVQEVAANQEGLTESITSTEERVANLEITADGINSSVSTLQKNIEETNGQIEAQTAQLRTEIQQNSDSVQIEIQNIKEEGAHKVVTNTGYTFDDDGLTVSKSTSGISTQITHDGMTVSEYNNELLSADSHGVSAKDLHARTYLIIGGNSRFEDYNSNRTACFWVGN